MVSTRFLVEYSDQNESFARFLPRAGQVIRVSWNFRHIVRLDKIRLFNSVNIECGYKSLTIYSPREVVPGETDS